MVCFFFLLLNAWVTCVSCMCRQSLSLRDGECVSSVGSLKNRKIEF